MFQSCDVLRRGVSSAIRRLIVRAFYTLSVLGVQSTRGHTDHVLTVAVDCTVRTGLQAIALDFLPPAFVAGSSNATPFLDRSGGT